MDKLVHYNYIVKERILQNSESNSGSEQF